jgi:hypothetical protein
MPFVAQKGRAWVYNKVKGIDLVAIKNASIQIGCRIGWKGPVAIIGVITLIIGMRKLFSPIAGPSQAPLSISIKVPKKTKLVSKLDISISKMSLIVATALEKVNQAEIQTKKASDMLVTANKNVEKANEDRSAAHKIWITARDHNLSNNCDETLQARKAAIQKWRKIQKATKIAIQEQDTAQKEVSLASANYKKSQAELDQRAEELYSLIKQLDKIKYLTNRYHTDKKTALNKSQIRDSHHTSLLNLTQQRRHLSRLRNKGISRNRSAIFLN